MSDGVSAGRPLRLLHISSDYPYTSVYSQLLAALEEGSGITQTMYVPLDRRADTLPKRELLTPKSRVIYSTDYRGIDRFFYHRKRRRVRERLVEQLDPTTFDLVHAHFLFSAGGVAYELGDRFSLPYLVSVRNTDVNVFFKKMIHLRSFGVEIMRRAERVVFLSPAYRQAVLEHYVPRSLREDLSSKMISIPSGADQSWFDPRPPSSHAPEGRELRLILAGEFTRNKNVEAVISATQRLRHLGLSASLHLIGTGPRESRIARIVAHNPGFLTRDPWTSSREDLRQAFRSADVFIMPSFRETFGLVYIEAISQGLPIIYSQGQGVDGYFQDGAVGYAVDPHDVEDIVDKVMRIRERYAEISAKCIEESQRFTWKKTAERLSEVYAESVDRPGSVR